MLSAISTQAPSKEGAFSIGAIMNYAFWILTVVIVLAGLFAAILDTYENFPEDR